MNCRIYGLLFRLLPLKKWQNHLIRIHFKQCPKCKPDTESINRIRSILYGHQDFQSQADLWPEVKEKIQQPPGSRLGIQKQGFRFPGLKWQWISASLLLIGMGILIPRLIFRGSVQTRPDDSAEHIIVKSIKLNDKPAKTYFFQSRNTKRMIIWVQKTN